jgi:hypothetical protein
VVTVCAPVGIAPAHGYSDESSEPEEHSKKLNSADGKLVGCTGKPGWCKDKVSDREESPDGREKHEVDAVGRPVYSVWAIISIHNCKVVSMETQEKNPSDVRYAVRPSTMIENRTCTPRRPRTTAGATIFVLGSIFDAGTC